MAPVVGGVHMDQRTTGFAVALGRDEDGNVCPVIIIYLDDQEFAVRIDRETARSMAIELLEIEAQCGGRQIAIVKRTDGKLDA